MECSNELSAYLAVQHLYVALLSVLIACQDIPNLHWNAHILLQALQECKLECINKYFNSHPQIFKVKTTYI